MRRSAMGFGVILLAATLAMAQSDVPQDRRDLHKDKQDVRQDRRDRNQDDSSVTHRATSRLCEIRPWRPRVPARDGRRSRRASTSRGRGA